MMREGVGSGARRRRKEERGREGGRGGGRVGGWGRQQEVQQKELRVPVQQKESKRNFHQLDHAQWHSKKPLTKIILEVTSS
jgi:hypothetical protein